MKRRFIYLFLVTAFFRSTSFCQIDFTTHYYPYIYKAELAIVNENYRDAVRFYDTAFNSVHMPFAKDYFNALVSASKVGDFATAYKYSDSLIAKGVKKDFFLNHGGLRLMWENPEWQEYIDNFSEKAKQFNYRRDTLLQKEFSQMYDRAVEFRRKPESTRLYSDTIQKIDSLNIIALQRIIETAGFPNENMTGISDPTNLYFPGYLNFFYHFERKSKKGEERKTFFEEQTAAIRRGELEPHKLSFFLDYQGSSPVQLGRYGLSVCSVNGVQSELFAEKYSPEEKTIIDHTRIHYGLEPLHEYHIKAKFVLRDKRSKEFAFRPYEHLNVYLMEDQEACDRKKAAFEVIE